MGSFGFVGCVYGGRESINLVNGVAECGKNAYLCIGILEVPGFHLCGISLNGIELDGLAAVGKGGGFWRVTLLFAWVGRKKDCGLRIGFKRKKGQSVAMAEPKFYISKYIRDSDDGVWKLNGVRKSLEDDFGHCRYKSMSGLNSRGKQKGVYTESYPESNALRVHVEPNAYREATTCTLTVYFFGSDPSLPTTLSAVEQVKVMEDGWHSLFDWMEGGLLLWYDEYRQRKALLYVSEAVEPSSDVVKNVPYLQCAVKLNNVFGKTFGSDDTTIEDWLASGGKEGADV